MLDDAPVLLDEEERTPDDLVLLEELLMLLLLVEFTGLEILVPVLLVLVLRVVVLFGLDTRELFVDLTELFVTPLLFALVVVALLEA